MDGWAIMNWVAWGLCAFFFLLIAKDFIQTEMSMRNEEGTSLDGSSSRKETSSL